jgi:hypothetical protein
MMALARERDDDLGSEDFKLKTFGAPAPLPLASD